MQYSDPSFGIDLWRKKTADPFFYIPVRTIEKKIARDIIIRDKVCCNIFY